LRKTDFEVVETNVDHIVDLCGNLRKTDYEDLAMYTGQSADEALVEGYKYSKLCWTVLHKKEPICIFGVADQYNGNGCVWLLGTDKMKDARISIIRESKFYVRKMLAPYKRIENWVYHKNELSIKWLKWCGFTIEEAKIAGVGKALFHHFYKENKEASWD